ncbi:P-loop containing nucleoside triphosphate hydrolase protein [Xylaria scruposa]|nr:P-loop containing nucleoside triphosphate hydrolase protein [Xylaria scruposa]
MAGDFDILSTLLTVKSAIDSYKDEESRDIERAIQASLEESYPNTSKGKDPDVAESSKSALKRPRADSGGDVYDDSHKRVRNVVRIIVNDDGGNVNDDNYNDLKRYVVERDVITTTAADIHFDKNTLEALDVIMLSLHDPAAFKFGILASSSPLGVLLYGPPGTGKTLLVRALAKRTNATTLTLSGADIRSKFVGEGERKIQRIFSYARKYHPCVIFIDEADGIFRSRSAESICRGHVEDINQFLEEMDGIRSNGAQNPVVIAATNRPFDIDEAILRRLTSRILIDMPDTAARDKIFRIHTEGENLADDVDVSELAQITEGYAGSDIKALVYAAAISAARENLLGTTAGLTLWEETVKSPAASNSCPRVLRMAHFLKAKQAIRLSPKSNIIARIQDFHNKMGDAAHRVVPADDTPWPSNKGKAPCP